MFQYPHIDPVAFSIGPLHVRWYGLAYLAAFVVGWFGLRSRAKKPWSRITPAQVDDIVFYAALGTILGGRIGYMLVYGWDELVANPLSIFTVWNGGMSFHGGLSGVLIGMWLYGRRIGQPFFVLTDAIAPWSTLGLFCGRIANFINNELWGKVTDVPWAVIVDGKPRHPSQLYEAFLEGIVLFTILWTYSRKPRPVMAASGLFLTFYGLFRILVEFVRVPDVQLGYLAFNWVTMGQILSLPMVIIGVILFVLAHRKREGKDGSPAGANAAAAPGHGARKKAA